MQQELSCMDILVEYLTLHIIVTLKCGLEVPFDRPYNFLLVGHYDYSCILYDFRVI